MPTKDVLLGLSQASGAPGAEGAAARLASELLSDFVPCHTDDMGNIIAQFGNFSSDIHIMLEAHIDEISLIATAVDDEGFIKADKCGGADRRVLSGAEVMVIGKKKLPGIVCCMPPHLTSGGGEIPEWDKIYIDVGLGGEKARELVPPGSRILMKVRPSELLNNRMSGKALDNRAGAAALIRAAQLLRGEREKLPCKVSVVLSTGEEVSGAGAGAAAFSLSPDIALCVDAGSGAQPGVAEEISGKLGEGVMIASYPTIDYKLSDTLKKLAKKHKIQWQNDVGGGKTGTSADKIASSGAGVPTALLSIPVTGMHTPAEICDISDIESTAGLICEFIKCGGVFE